MSEAASKSSTGISFAFERRRELPDHVGDFYRDAGKARSAFERSRSPHTEAPTVSDKAEGTADAPPADGPRMSGFQLPAPHPSFAVPRRRSEIDGWLQARAEKEAAETLPKDAFVTMRLAQTFRAKSVRQTRSR
jgi:hypothetical protein